jgi:hypothetical protein
MGLMLWGKSAALVDGNIREKRTPAGKMVHGLCSSERVGAVGGGMHFWRFGVYRSTLLLSSAYLMNSSFA